MTVREATPADWPAIWRFMDEIVAAGETFSWDREIAEADARAIWMGGPPKRTFVAVDDGDRVLGSAVLGPNHGGTASHVATASFMVDPAAVGRGAGRALGERVLDQARADGYRAMQFNAVVSTNVRAVALWQRLGFVIVGTLPRAFRHREHGEVDAYVMHRFL